MNLEYKKRRNKLSRLIGKDGIVILPTAPYKNRSRDTYYPYRPDSDFFYFTGFSEPDALMILAPGRPEGEFILLLRPKDPLKETWDGHMEGLIGAKQNFDANQSYKIGDLGKVLTEVFPNRQKIFYTLGQHNDYDKKVIDTFNQVRANQRRLGVVPTEVVSLEPLIHDMRLVKSREEIRRMKEAARISVEAHYRVMDECKEGVYEYQIQASINHQFGQYGTVPAYDSIVASGSNACTLHYIENKDILKSGDLLLTDAGCEHQMYAADITRTVPVSGTFSEQQKAIYSIVLDTQKNAIESVRPGQTFENIQNNAINSITKGLRKLDLLSGSLKSLIKNEAYKDFYMHGIGHWLGMDVHDVGSYMSDAGKAKKFVPGMVLTIEPGIYISRKNNKVQKPWRG
ncbi:MAG TPA: M24 family metallopeptidase, partial [Gammaproteobacteria bacterium]|nr:M24 family metallopeptidase [Gammaproteobacteria bacterium]